MLRLSIASGARQAEEVGRVTAEDHSPAEATPVPPCRGALVTQAEVDRAIGAITDYCKRTGRPLTDVATDILQGRLVIKADTLGAPGPGIVGRSA